MQGWKLMTVLFVFQISTYHVASGVSCATMKCMKGYTCVDTTVVCVTAPCDFDPIGKCVPDEKKGACPLVLAKQRCIDDVKDLCAADADCIGSLKCCSKGCYKACTRRIRSRGKPRRKHRRKPKRKSRRKPRRN